MKTPQSHPLVMLFAHTCIHTHTYRDRETERIRVAETETDRYRERENAKYLLFFKNIVR